jgi:hypothetical protein
MRLEENSFEIRRKIWIQFLHFPSKIPLFQRTPYLMVYQDLDCQIQLVIVTKVLSVRFRLSYRHRSSYFLVAKDL